MQLNNFTVIQNVNDLSSSSGGPSKTVTHLSKELISSGTRLKLFSKCSDDFRNQELIPQENLVLYKGKRVIFNPFF